MFVNHLPRTKRIAKRILPYIWGICHHFLKFTPVFTSWIQPILIHRSWGLLKLQQIEHSWSHILIKLMKVSDKSLGLLHGNKMIALLKVLAMRNLKKVILLLFHLVKLSRTLRIWRKTHALRVWTLRRKKLLIKIKRVKWLGISPKNLPIQPKKKQYLKRELSVTVKKLNAWNFIVIASDRG